MLCPHLIVYLQKQGSTKRKFSEASDRIPNVQSSHFLCMDLRGVQPAAINVVAEQC